MLCNLLYLPYFLDNITKLYMVPIFSSHPSGTILLRTKAICSKRTRILISISVNYMLSKRYISDTIIHIKCFSLRGRTQIQKIQKEGTESLPLPSPSPPSPSPHPLNENFTFQDMQHSALWVYS